MQRFAVRPRAHALLSSSSMVLFMLLFDLLRVPHCVIVGLCAVAITDRSVDGFCASAGCATRMAAQRASPVDRQAPPALVAPPPRRDRRKEVDRSKISRPIRGSLLLSLLDGSLNDFTSSPRGPEAARSPVPRSFGQCRLGSCSTSPRRRAALVSLLALCGRRANDLLRTRDRQCSRNRKEVTWVSVGPELNPRCVPRRCHSVAAKVRSRELQIRRLLYSVVGNDTNCV